MRSLIQIAVLAMAAAGVVAAPADAKVDTADVNLTDGADDASPRGGRVSAPARSGGARPVSGGGYRGGGRPSGGGARPGGGYHPSGGRPSGGRPGGGYRGGGGRPVGGGRPGGGYRGGGRPGGYGGRPGYGGGRGGVRHGGGYHGGGYRGGPYRGPGGNWDGHYHDGYGGYWRHGHGGRFGDVPWGYGYYGPHYGYNGFLFTPVVVPIPEIGYIQPSQYLDDGEPCDQTDPDQCYSGMCCAVNTGEGAFCLTDDDVENGDQCFVTQSNAVGGGTIILPKKGH